MMTGAFGEIRLEYNARGEAVRVVEIDWSDSVVRDDRLIWAGGQVVAVTDALNNRPARRYYGQGMMVGSSAYLFTRDHLGSVREVLSAGDRSVVARLDYDPYGTVTLSQGGAGLDLHLMPTYAGYLHLYPHEVFDGWAGYDAGQFELHLTKFRAYDPQTGRWLSRDPIGEEAGINLYAYCENDPIRMIDPLGLEFGDYWDIDATMNYYAQAQVNSTSGFARTGAKVANVLLGFFGADTAQKAGNIYADPNCSFKDKALVTGKLGMHVVGNASVAWRGLGALRAPSKLIHFTSAERAVQIANSGKKIGATGLLTPGKGIFGKGIYASTSSSRIVGTVQGAHSTERMITVSLQVTKQQGLTLVPTWIPGSYRIVGGALVIP